MIIRQPVLESLSRYVSFHCRLQSRQRWGAGTGFCIWHSDEAGDDDNIADAGTVGRRTVDRNNSRAALCRDGVGGETLAVGDIPDINGFVFENTGCVKKIWSMAQEPS